MFPEMPPGEWEAMQAIKEVEANRKRSWAEKLVVGLIFFFTLVFGFAAIAVILLYVFSPSGHWLLICAALFCLSVILLWIKESFPNIWEWISRIFYEWPIAVVGFTIGIALVAGLFWGIFFIIRMCVRAIVF